MLVEWRFADFLEFIRWDFNKHSSSVRKLNQQKLISRILHLTPSSVNLDAVRVVWQKTHVAFPENFLENLCLNSWKSCKMFIMTRYKHLTLTNTNMYANLLLLWFMFYYVLINKFGFPLHLTFVKYLYMWLRRS